MEQVKVKCFGMDEEGKGLIKVRGRLVHVSNLLEGETAVVEVIQRKDFIKAKVIKIVEKSKDRVSSKCPYFIQCGGCQLQHMSYESQAEFKQQKIEKLMKPYGKVNKILTMQEPYYYRNKIHSTLAQGKNGKVISGIYEENTHNVIPIESCLIQDKRADEIVASVKEIMKSFKLRPYDEDSGQGFLRHVLIKTGFASNEIMVVLIVSSQVFPGKNNFIKLLLQKHPEITTIVMNINNRKTSVVLGEVEKVLYGKGYIEDTLCDCVFQISPKSFYQVNPIQTEILYEKAINMAKLTGKETVLDAYCGIGTISLIASRKAKSVIGVELNKDAVRDAVKNAKRNKISNVMFYNDDAGDFMVNLSKEKQNIDTVFMDPPRSGSDEKFLSSIVKLKPRQIIYISCNAVTQERDLNYLTKNGYKVEKIQPVDMFPHTSHVETVCLLERK
ncbi:23S rRNA (uracil(1939)-C(5))-methyltransferase RlmD [Clostridium swellfunianum]|uniref:23S rRNA (uracil(1939)-C(5))-methyltransferase RlmD n=1 Tax=Clostridium swellfunianum TaxID=1367462 RepID=UPI00202DED35|nr:23S rRNA (uracil(1939)-C(5))-methyltransferase RlmD [Clostridium swellfunianum]MCM0650541.1 23S rRNA (uracil(1939)-C(5))-methyltransferase RlmD [Clostridium swellfunianum]